MQNGSINSFKIGDISATDPMLGILEGLRAIAGQKDELLFHSGGPIGKSSRFSMIPILDGLRVVFHQPPSDSKSIDANPLRGEIDLQPTPPLKLKIQHRSEGNWTTMCEESHETLELALRSISELEFLGEVDPSSGLSPGGFAGVLGYDLGQWTNPIRLKNTPRDHEVLGILWRTKGWVIHDREHHSITSLGDFPLSKDQVSDCIARTSKPTKMRTHSELETEDREDHKRKILEIIRAIEEGHVYQVNYGRNWTGSLDQDPWNCFLNLANSNPAPYSAWMSSPDLGWTIVSSSPEQLLCLRDGDITTSPIKGTAPRGDSVTNDERTKDDLKQSKKDLAEHMMLVDLEMHDLSSVCIPGSVEWRDFRLESHPNVHHLVSEIGGTIQPPFDVPSVISSLFPGGSITGCPKVMSMAIINYLEHRPRGAWTGSIGHIHNLNNLVDLNIMIRTMEVVDKVGIKIGRVMAGGGIVHSSVPEIEAQEAEWKADAILRAAWDISASTLMDSLPRMEISYQPLIRKSEGCRASNVERESEFRKIILIDNMDSFTHNIRDALVRLGSDVIILKGWSLEPDENVRAWASEIIDSHSPTGLVIGPGPSRPESYNRTTALVDLVLKGDLRSSNGHIPTLGVCLGHQAICLADGSSLLKSPNGPIHGSPVEVENDSTGLFSDLPQTQSLMRYNSLIVTAPGNNMIPNAWEKKSGLIMGTRHRYLPVHGIQFHPESAGSPDGTAIIENFLKLCN